MSDDHNPADPRHVDLDVPHHDLDGPSARLLASRPALVALLARTRGESSS